MKKLRWSKEVVKLLKVFFLEIFSTIMFSKTRVGLWLKFSKNRSAILLFKHWNPSTSTTQGFCLPCKFWFFALGDKNAFIVSHSHLYFLGCLVFGLQNWCFILLFVICRPEICSLDRYFRKTRNICHSPPSWSCSSVPFGSAVSSHHQYRSRHHCHNHLQSRAG